MCTHPADYVAGPGGPCLLCDPWQVQHQAWQMTGWVGQRHPSPQGAHSLLRRPVICTDRGQCWGGSDHTPTVPYGSRVGGGHQALGDTGGPDLTWGHGEVLTEKVSLELNEPRRSQKAFLGQGTASAKALGQGLCGVTTCWVPRDFRLCKIHHRWGDLNCKHVSVTALEPGRPGSRCQRIP